MWFAGIMRQYSKKANPQLARTSFHKLLSIASPGLRRKPYQAKVMTVLLITRRTAVKNRRVTEKEGIAPHGTRCLFPCQYPIRVLHATVHCKIKCSTTQARGFAKENEKNASNILKSVQKCVKVEGKMGSGESRFPHRNQIECSVHLLIRIEPRLIS